MGMDTDALRWFQQVADGTTVTEVSELEVVTQSGVSRALARLEAQVGTPLLRRSGRTLRMTHAGAVFKRHVDALLHQLDDGIAAVNQLIDPDTGTVALAFQHSLGTWLVPDLVSSFRAAHPQRQLPAHPGPRRGCTPRRSTAAGPTWRSAPGAGDPSVHSRLSPSSRCGWRCPATTSWPPGRRSGWPSWPASRSWPCGRTSALRKLGDDLCEEAGFRPDVVFEGDDLSTVRGFVAAGLGVAIVPAPREGSPESGAGPLRYLRDPRRVGGPGDHPDLVGGAAAAASRGAVPPPRDPQAARAASRRSRGNETLFLFLTVVPGYSHRLFAGLPRRC